MTRRALLGGAIGVVLVGCAAETEPEPAPQPSPSPTAAPEPGPTPEPEPDIDVEAVIAEHEGREPTEWGMHFAGIVRTGSEAASPSPDAVFLTLDACGGPYGSGYDAVLIDGLIAAEIPATLFLNSRWIEVNRATAEELAANELFSIQNHGSRHLPLSVTGRDAYGIVGTASAREAAMEVWDNRLVIEELTGRAPQWFRPGTAHLDDVGMSIAEALGERIAGFAVDGDAGATLSAASVAAEIGAARGGELVLAHMNQPGSGTADGLLEAVNVLRDRGIAFARL